MRRGALPSKPLSFDLVDMHTLLVEVVPSQLESPIYFPVRLLVRRTILDLCIGKRL